MYIRSILIQTDYFYSQSSEHLRDMKVNNSSKYFQYFYMCDPGGGGGSPLEGNLLDRLTAEKQLEGAVLPEQTGVKRSQLLLTGVEERQRNHIQHVCPLSGRVSSEADGKCSLNIKKHHQ